ncbi:MAG: LysM peptidoglycan-binding domain-containing protein [Acidimicrobiia bacterium]
MSRHRATPSLAAKASSSTSAASTTSTTTPRAATEYTVRSGDTITAIAVRYHVAPAAIVLANRLRGPDHLTIGQTLIIPPPPVVELVFRPATVAPGREVALTLTGAQPGELVRFAFSSPVGSFTGPRHVASARGEVAAAYTPGVDEPGGITTVVAIGDDGTTTRAELMVRPDPVG